ncbi:hypothetical protein RvY_07632 [Ramazzottius varieornatus]|uniref:Uncharacterized protein n=1 Tax=Ramazzottius varieornatus TaxID=947166 RepID=A0A1D1V2W6_RAMVA|nr:hypothetical protein RvY_07632 [Ramazzottius varieornatus]
MLLRIEPTFRSCGAVAVHGGQTSITVWFCASSHPAVHQILRCGEHVEVFLLRTRITYQGQSLWTDIWAVPYVIGPDCNPTGKNLEYTTSSPAQKQLLLFSFQHK